MGRKFTIFVLFLLCFREQIPGTSPPGGLYSEGRFNGGFLRYDFEGLIFGGAYTWRGLFSEFYGITTNHAITYTFWKIYHINWTWAFFKSVPNLVRWLIFNVNVLVTRTWIITDQFWRIRPTLASFFRFTAMGSPNGQPTWVGEGRLFEGGYYVIHFRQR